MINLFQYFDIKFLVIKDNPKFRFILKEKFKQNKSPLFKQKGQPVSGSCKEYYWNYLGQELGEKVFRERKKHFGQKKAFAFFKKHKLLTKQDIILVEEYFQKIYLKTKVNREKVTNTKEYRNSLRKGQEKNKHLSSQRLKQRWVDSETRASLVKKLFSEETKKRRVNNFKKHVSENYEKYLEAMNQPERKEKLRQYAYHRINTKEEKMVKWLNSCRSRQFESNGVKMNKIEFLVAEFLSSLKLNWEYEKIFNLGKKSYIPDFYIPKLNLIIECNGDYWHANPKLFKENEKIKRTKLTAKEIWERDKQRVDDFKKHGFNIIPLWEEEILNDNFKIIIKKWIQ